MELLYIVQQLGMPMKEVAVNWEEIEGEILSLQESELSQEIYF